jgi:L-malate glycosyltransferase
MKILHLIQKSQNRGAEIFTSQLSNHLLASGHQVKIVALFKGESILHFDGEIFQLNASSRYRFIDVRAWKKLAGFIKEFNPDIIQANAGDTLKYAVFSKILFGWKAPIIFRNASEIGRYLNSQIHKNLNVFLFKHVKYVISVSEASEKDILNNFPFLSGQTEVIPVGLEILSKIENIKLKPENVQHIVHVGGFSFEKNHSGLLEIFQSVLKGKQNIHLHLIGDGPLRAKIEEGVKNINLTKNITFYGFVNNPLSYIKAADVLVLPSIIEGLPGVLLEAMMCKTPVIAYNVGGISEIVNQQTGILIEKDDVKKFAKEVLRIMESTDLDVIEAAHRMVRKKYMNEEIALRFERVYKMMI